MLIYGAADEHENKAGSDACCNVDLWSPLMSSAPAAPSPRDGPGCVVSNSRNRLQKNLVLDARMMHRCAQAGSVSKYFIITHSVMVYIALLIVCFFIYLYFFFKENNFPEQISCDYDQPNPEPTS